MQKLKKIILLVGWLSGVAGILPAMAAMIYADNVTSLIRGDLSVGSLDGFYGGDFLATWPAPYTDAEARAAVLGSPDNLFLSLPGRNDVPLGNPWPYTYVEVSFPGTFSPNDSVVITELGDAEESARVWIWATGGGFIETEIARNGINDNIVIDLSPWAGIYTEFDRIGIGGLDEGGGSYGFDLDAVGVQMVVPIPAAVWLFGSGLCALLSVAPHRKRIA